MTRASVKDDEKRYNNWKNKNYEYSQLHNDANDDYKAKNAISTMMTITTVRQKKYCHTDNWDNIDINNYN